MHGIVPVPAPATSYLLRDMPAYAGRIRGELLTPTGAALLKYFADEYAYMPAMRIQAVGCGMGMKEFEAANCVRAMIGIEEEKDAADEVAELHCNLEDMTGEAIAYACGMLMEQGALDVYLTPIQMKKGRPGTKLSCICRIPDVQRLTEQMLRHTTTLGVRMQRMQRCVLQRECAAVNTPYGEIGVKYARGDGFVRCKAEYDDAARAAHDCGASILEVMRAAENAQDN